MMESCVRLDLGTQKNNCSEFGTKETWRNGTETDY